MSTESERERGGEGKSAERTGLHSFAELRPNRPKNQTVWYGQVFFFKTVLTANLFFVPTLIFFNYFYSNRGKRGTWGKNRSIPVNRLARARIA